MDLTIEAVDLNALARDVREYLGQVIAERGARVELALAENLPPALTDRVQLEEVLLNLVRNAVQAVPDGGRVAVETGLANEHTAEIVVRDNGPGIPREHLSRLFEPFLTTKERGKGTGLGLYISHGIMKRLGGAIAVESEPGAGTAFRVEVPVRSCVLRDVTDAPERAHR